MGAFRAGRFGARRHVPLARNALANAAGRHMRGVRGLLLALLLGDVLDLGGEGGHPDHHLSGVDVPVGAEDAVLEELAQLLRQAVACGAQGVLHALHEAGI